MLRTERQRARMSKIKNSGLDQYGAEPFEQQQFGTAVIQPNVTNSSWQLVSISNPSTSGPARSRFQLDPVILDPATSGTDPPNPLDVRSNPDPDLVHP